MSDLMKPPPNFPEGEKAVLAACFIDEGCIAEVLSCLSHTDFYHSSHRAIFTAISDLTEAGQPIDWMTVPEILKTQGNLEKAGGSAALVDLADSLPSTANVGFYIKKVKEYAKLRLLLGGVSEIERSIRSGNTNLLALQSDLQSLAFSGVSQTSKRRLASMHEVISENFCYVGAGQNTGVKCGLLDLDYILGGFRPGELIVIGGRPSMGKTALLLDLAVGYSASAPVGIFSIEMPNRDLMFRLLAKRAHVDLKNLRIGFLDDSGWKAVTTAAGDLADYQLYFDDSGSFTPSQIRMKAKEVAVRTGNQLGMIGIDYLQLMKANSKHNSENDRLNSITTDLKILARELEIPIVLLSQLNRDLERRDFKNNQRRPKLSDFRGSGGIEQDADVVIGLYRGEVYPEAKGVDGETLEHLKGKAEAIVLKQRNGPTGIVNLQWDAPTATFRNAAREREEYHGLEGEM